MATFLHRFCLFGLLTTTGFALSNCQREAEEQEAPMMRAPSGPTMSAGDSMMPAQRDGGMRVGEAASVLDAGMDHAAMGHTDGGTR